MNVAVKLTEHGQELRGITRLSLDRELEMQATRLHTAIGLYEQARKWNRNGQYLAAERCIRKAEQVIANAGFTKDKEDEYDAD